MSEPETPVPGGANGPLFGSDALADAIRALDIPYVAMNPGASYRGLHDSLVNYLGNTAPKMILTLHEENAVAIAHGYAKVTERPMLAAIHANIGLMHGSMGIFNAWCDRAPMVVLGATGPVDAARRRPWIDWIHTAADQGALIRPFVKWDDQPASPAAAREAIFRANWIARTAPRGPVYVNFGVELQEAALPAPLPPVDPARFQPPVEVAAPADAVARLADLLKAAKRPVILAGRVSRSPEAWDRRIALAESVGARVATDLKTAAAFPNEHPLHVSPAGVLPTPAVATAIREADLIVSLDWVDLAGTLKAAFEGADVAATIVHVSQDHQLHNGWSMDHQGLPPVDLLLAAEPDTVVAQVLPLLPVGVGQASRPAVVPPQPDDAKLTIHDLGAALRAALGEQPASLAHGPLSGLGDHWPIRDPLDYLGSDGGAGIGAGPGLVVGAALALKGSGRHAVAVMGDGDFLMGVTAFWSAVHYRIPLLVVIANNHSFFNDEVHQERVARMRGRPPENKWIGMRIDDPPVDLAALARAQGVTAYGPVATQADLRRTLAQAVADLEAGQVVVVDAEVVRPSAAATPDVRRG